MFEKSLGTLYYAGDWIPVRESSVKAPDKLGLSSVIVASNELCYHTNCSRWFYVFFGQWNLTVSYNSTKPSYWAVRFWTKVVYFVACAVLMTQNEDTSVKKKNSSCHSVAWYHWISQKIGCICFLISNSVGNVNFHISNFQHTAILLKVYNWTELIWIFA